MVNNIRVMLLCILCAIVSLGMGLQVSRLQSVRKVFQRRQFPFLTPTNVTALSGISLDFTTPISTFIGTSGSGKSTLAKVISGKYLPSSGTVDRTTESGVVTTTSSSYLDQHFYMTYDATKRTSEVIGFCNSSWCYDAYLTLELPDTRIDTLLLSQRRIFEIMLAISRTGSSHPPLVVLDEYLDKDFPSVLEVIKSELVRLCGSIQLQVIVVTHSANVAKVFCDDVIALNGGRVYSRSSGLAFLSRMPSQLTMI